MWAAWHATALWESMWTLSWKPVTPAIVYNAAKLTRYWSKVWPIITIVFWYILRNISVCVNLFYPKFTSDPHFSTVQYGSTQDWRLERRRTVWRWECIVNKARPGIAELCWTGCGSLVLSYYLHHHDNIFIMYIGIKWNSTAPLCDVLSFI